MVIKNKVVHGSEPADVIDMGGPRRRRARAPYTPNARLYPAVRASKKKPKGSNTKLHRKKKTRPASQLVPNARLYQARPRRPCPPPPPAWPAMSWAPNVPTACLDTASGVALRLAEKRAEQSPTPPSPVCCPAAATRQPVRMSRPRRAAAVVQADCWYAALAALTALAALAAPAAPSPDSGTSEELRQALVLVDILRSGMARRRMTTSLAAVTAAFSAEAAPWAGPQGAFPVPYYSYHAPFRRFYGGGHGGRQLQYDDSFGAHPGDPTDANDAFTSAPVISKDPENQLSSTSSFPTPELLTTVAAVTVLTSSPLAPVRTTAAATAVVPTGTTVAPTRTSMAPARNIATNAAEAPARTTAVAAATHDVHTLAHANSLTTKTKSPRTTPAATNAPKINKLKYIKEDKIRTKAPNEEGNKVRQSDEHLEISQAAAELQREATAGGQRGSGARLPWRLRGTTRVYLARSSVLPRPLPENNAFCYASPRSPLCRTFI